MKISFKRKISCVSYWNTVVLFIMLAISTNLANAATDKVELIKVAHEGLNYFLVSASFNPSFSKSLTSEQRSIVSELSLMLNEASALRFYEENKIDGFARNDGSRIFGYVDFAEKVQTLNIEGKKSPTLMTSFQREEFKNLKPGEPERFLKTTSDFEGPIKINVLKLNEDLAMPFDLGRAVSILVHEYGHKVRARLEKKMGSKISDAQIQPNIDKLGEDLGNYIRGKIQKYPLKNGINIFSLGALDFPAESWLNDGFLKPQAPLTILHNQGLYVWTEFQGEIRDISAVLRKQINQSQLSKDNLKNTYYKFVHHQMFLPTAFNITESKIGDINVDITFGQISVELPYMIPKISPDPKAAEFDKRFRWSAGGYIINPVTAQIQARANGSGFLIQGVYVDPRQIGPLPQLSAQLGKVEKKGTELQFRIEVKDQEGITTQLALFRGLMLKSAELKIKAADGKSFYLTSEEYDGSKANSDRMLQYVFKLKNAVEIPISEFEIEAVYLRTQPDLISEHSEARMEVPLYEKLKVSWENPNLATELKPKNPPVITSVESKGEIVKVKINTTENIDKLSLVLGVQDIMYSLHIIEQNAEKIYYKFTDNLTTDRMIQVQLNSNQISVQRFADYAEVSFKLSDLYSDRRFQLLDENLNSHGIKMQAGIAHVFGPNIKIQEISILTTSLQTSSLKTTHSYKAYSSQTSHSQLDQVLIDFVNRPVRYRTSGVGRCEFLFN